MDHEYLKKFYSEAHWREYNRGFAKGFARGFAKTNAGSKAEALLILLRERGLAITSDQEDRILTCTDPATVERWLDRTFSVASIDDLLA